MRVPFQWLEYRCLTGRRLTPPASSLQDFEDYCHHALKASGVHVFFIARSPHRERAPLKALDLCPVEPSERKRFLLQGLESTCHRTSKCLSLKSSFTLSAIKTTPCVTVFWSKGRVSLSRNSLPHAGENDTTLVPRDCGPCVVARMRFPYGRRARLAAFIGKFVSLGGVYMRSVSRLFGH